MMEEKTFQEMTETIWKRSEEELTRAVESAILNEMRAYATSQTRKLVARRVDELIKPLLEKRQAALEARLDDVLQELEGRALAYVKTGVSRAIAQHVSQVTGEILRNTQRTVEADVHRALSALPTEES